MNDARNTASAGRRQRCTKSAASAAMPMRAKHAARPARTAGDMGPAKYSAPALHTVQAARTMPAKARLSAPAIRQSANL
jgi:hypothetical protein